MKYKVALKKSKEGYSVSCPGLPGCWSQGKTEQEALENIQYAIREYFETVAMISKGSKIREVEVLV
jgi:predicted RNase H-like HicB family nuclease